MYDCVVVGAGIVGACAAYNLVKGGKNILLIDQFPLPHCRGSSHGPIRVLSNTHSDPVYVKMALDGIPMWKQLEEETGTTLIRKTGTLYIDKYPYTDLNTRRTNAIKDGLRYDVLSSSDVRRRYPGIMDIPSDLQAFFDMDTHTVKSDKAIACLLEQVKAHGGVIRDEEKVEAIIPGTVVTVRTNKGTHKCAKLVLAPGSWAKKLLQPLGLNPPLRITRAKVCYWEEPVPGLTSNYPVIIDRALDRPKDLKEVFFGYAFPSDEYPGLRKIGVHHGTVTDPDARDFCPDDKMFLKIFSDYVRSRYPGSGATPRIVESCIYSDTPDDVMILDTVPHHPNIAYCCGLSGRGFRCGMRIGRLLTELLFEGKTSYDISTFRLSRFPQTQIAGKY